MVPFPSSLTRRGAVMRHRYADRARPHRGVVHDKPGHEVLIFAGRNPVLQARTRITL